MFGNILFVSFIILSLFQFSKGVRLGIQNPILLLSGIFSLLLFYLLIHLVSNKIDSGISIGKNSLISKLKENGMAKIVITTLLWILAIGNFTYANNWKGTPLTNGAEYIEAVILSLISFVILNKNIKKV